MKHSRILVIDDEELICDLAVSKLTSMGCEVITAKDGLSGLKSVERFSPNVVVTDVQMPNMGGLEVLRKVKVLSPDTDVILMTGYGDTPTIIEALRTGAHDFLGKPFDFEDLAESIKRILAAQTVKRQQKELQVQLSQSEKLASVGTLAAGVAHEFNSSVAVVIAYVDEMLSLLKGPSVEPHSIAEMISHLEMVAKSSARMQKLIKTLLASARKSFVVDLREVDLAAAIKNSVLPLEAVFAKKGISVVFSYSPENPCFSGDFEQIESIFASLLSNSSDAFDAILDHRDKRISFTTSARGAGGDLLIIYEDNAGGMSEQTRRRIFDPFFTTKDVGKGIGLGMSATLALVEAHHGTISVETTLGVGSRFVLTFPTCRPQATQEKVSA
ncbi:response regulator [Bdellovibrionota bacterium FG-2]